MEQRIRAVQNQVCSQFFNSMSNLCSKTRPEKGKWGRQGESQSVDQGNQIRASPKQEELLGNLFNDVQRAHSGLKTCALENEQTCTTSISTLKIYKTWGDMPGLQKTQPHLIQNSAQSWLWLCLPVITEHSERMRQERNNFEPLLLLTNVKMPF